MCPVMTAPINPATRASNTMFLGLMLAFRTGVRTLGAEEIAFLKKGRSGTSMPNSLAAATRVTGVPSSYLAVE